MSRLPRGLYVITDAQLLPGARLLEGVRAAILGGAVTVQYRDKGKDAQQRREQAEALVTLCRALGAVFIINDDPALAAAVRADGVHLGKDDAAFQAARALLGPEAIIGVSCYDSLARAREAQALGADYVAFGSFFPSVTKPKAVPAPLSLLTEAHASLTVPVVAIGGITPENGPALVDAGADALAVISGVFGAADIRAAALQYRQLFANRIHAAPGAEQLA